MHGEDSFIQELVEVVDLFAEARQFRIVKIFVDLEPDTVAGEDFGGALFLHVLEGGANFTGLLQRKNLELI